MTTARQAVQLLVAILLLPMSAGAELLSRQDFRASVCNIASMDIDVKIDESFSEPVITSKMRWQAGSNTNNDCLSGITHVWLKVRTTDDAVRYIRIRPEVAPAGNRFSNTATESPSWAVLYCQAPSDGARCEPEIIARELFASELRYEGFEVVTEGLSISTLAGTTDNPRGPDNDTDNLLGDLLLDAIDAAVLPEGDRAEPAEETPPPVVEVSPQDTAKLALDEVVNLMSSTLAEYTTPPHSCETQRKINHWVQAKSTCELTFRSESNHQYLCSGGQPRPVKVTRNATVNLSRDIAGIDAIRLAEGRWATLVLELSGDLHTDVEAAYQSNRWQITTSDDRVEDLKRLASSLEALRGYCTTNAGSS